MTYLLELFSVPAGSGFIAVMIVFLAMALKYTWLRAEKNGYLYGLDHALDAVEEALELDEDDTNALYNKMAENLKTRLIVVDE
jgi:hypothetical protein